MRNLSRREWLENATAAGALIALERFVPPAYAHHETSAASAPARILNGVHVVDLSIAEFKFSFDGRVGSAIAANGSVPGPLIRLREGETAVLRVTNHLRESTSIHWHGLLVPHGMDGVPGVSFAGIAPGATFTYRFPVRQSGTYWAHSHSGAQELLGLYFPLIIDPVESEPFQYDRDYVVMLSDWSFETPMKIISHLKKQPGYYNFQKRTVADLFRDAKEKGWSATLKDRSEWAKMRMDATDFADITASSYTYLMNGLSARQNWTGTFMPGQKVRLRFINAGAMTYFDLRVPGLKLTLVQADGQNVAPVEVDEFRIAPGETYDVLVTPENRAYTLFAESLDRSGFARGTLAPACRDECRDSTAAQTSRPQHEGYGYGHVRDGERTASFDARTGHSRSRQLVRGDDGYRPS
jgi:CopA family copper-resistance protein